MRSSSARLRSRRSRTTQQTTCSAAETHRTQSDLDRISLPSLRRAEARRPAPWDAGAAPRHTAPGSQRGARAPPRARAIRPPAPRARPRCSEKHLQQAVEMKDRPSAPATSTGSGADSRKARNAKHRPRMRYLRSSDICPISLIPHPAATNLPYLKAPARESDTMTHGCGRRRTTGQRNW